MLFRLLTRVLLLVFAILLVARFVPGVSVDSFATAVVVALLLALINMTIRPILFILTLPITLLTFGIFALVLNAVLLWFVASLVDGFTVGGFAPAFLSALLISVVTWVGNRFIRKEYDRL